MKQDCGETSSRTQLIGNIARLFFDEQRRSVTSRIFAGMHRNFHFRFHGYQQLFQTAAVTKLLRYGGGQIGRWNPFTINHRTFQASQKTNVFSYKCKKRSILWNALYASISICDRNRSAWTY